MALVVKDRVKETTTTTGTGTVTLNGASAGFQSFSVIGDSNTTYYAIVDAGSGDFEIGIGTYTSSGTTLSRDTILESSNAGSAVNFAAGIKDVFVTYPAERSIYVDGGNIVPAEAARLGFANLAQGSALSVLGVTGNATANVASVAAASDHQVLRRSGTAVAFGAVALNQANAVTGTLPVARGGTGQTTYTNGQLLIGNTTGGTLAKATLTAGTGVSITNGAGSISIAATNNGTVTSVGGTGTVNGLTLTGTVTSSGNLTLGGTLAISATQITSGTLAVARGGTGVTTSTGTGSVVRATSPVLVTPALGTPSSGNLANCTFPTLNQNTTGNAATATALQNARTIGGVSFNGTANINLPGVNTAGNQNTTGSAASLTTARAINGTNFNGTAAITTANWGTARTLWGSSVNGSANITAPLRPAAGSVSAPAFSTSADTNTGIFFPAADTIAITEGGVEVIRVNSSSNVGVGTTTPGEKLDVNGSIRGEQLIAANGIIVNSATVSANYTIPTGSNAISGGPVAVDAGVTVTVSAGSVWTVV